MQKRQDMHQAEKPLSRGMWVLLFLVASFIMSLWFQTFKTFTLVPTLGNAMLWLFVMFLLAQVVIVLIYDSYVLEKSRGRIQKPIRLFEWMIRKRFLLRSVLEQKEDIR
jgi:glucan phosphoethanolaminetransferase (alkaline phosphatase superfamily)